MTTAAGPVQVVGEVLSVKHVNDFHHVTLVAPGVAERFRPGSLVSVAVGGPMSDRLARRAFPIHRARPTGAYGGTVEVVVVPREPGTSWLANAAAGTPVDVVGPLGRPFALPKEPVATLLVGAGVASAQLFALAERLRGRGCPVHMLIGAGAESGLFGLLDARRTASSVTVVTEDGSVGIRGAITDVLGDVLARSVADVVYAAGPSALLEQVAAAAERHGAWSQAALDVVMPCGTGLCHACVVPIVGEDGATRMLRACTDGPVFRGDRVRWPDLGQVPADALGAAGWPARDAAADLVVDR